MQSASTLATKLESSAIVLDRHYPRFSLPLLKQPKPNTVRIQDSQLAAVTPPGASFNVLTGVSSDTRPVSDFCLALILVLAAAFFLDFAAMM